MYLPTHEALCFLRMSLRWDHELNETMATYTLVIQYTPAKLVNSHCRPHLQQSHQCHQLPRAHQRYTDPKDHSDHSMCRHPSLIQIPLAAHLTCDSDSQTGARISWRARIMHLNLNLGSADNYSLGVPPNPYSLNAASTGTYIYNTG